MLDPIEIKLIAIGSKHNALTEIPNSQLFTLNYLLNHVQQFTNRRLYCGQCAFYL
jgi:hypothetical protein